MDALGWLGWRWALGYLGRSRVGLNLILACFRGRVLFVRGEWGNDQIWEEACVQCVRQDGQAHLNSVASICDCDVSHRNKQGQAARALTMRFMRRRTRTRWCVSQAHRRRRRRGKGTETGVGVWLHFFSSRKWGANEEIPRSSSYGRNQRSPLTVTGPQVSRVRWERAKAFSLRPTTTNGPLQSRRQ